MWPSEKSRSPGPARKESFPGGMETWLQRKQKSFLLSLKLAAHSLARGTVALTTSHTFSWDPSVLRGPLQRSRRKPI